VVSPSDRALLTELLTKWRDEATARDYLEPQAAIATGLCADELKVVIERLVGKQREPVVCPHTNFIDICTDAGQIKARWPVPGNVSKWCLDCGAFWHYCTEKWQFPKCPPPQRLLAQEGLLEAQAGHDVVVTVGDNGYATGVNPVNETITFRGVFLSKQQWKALLPSLGHEAPCPAYARHGEDEIRDCKCDLRKLREMLGAPHPPSEGEPKPQGESRE